MCTLSIAATDPNAVALSLRASAAYSVLAKCRVKVRRNGRKVFKMIPCRKAKLVPIPVRNLSLGFFSAKASKLPYGERIRFSTIATDAAGLRQATPSVRTITLRKPKRKLKRR